MRGMPGWPQRTLDLVEDTYTFDLFRLGDRPYFCVIHAFDPDVQWEVYQHTGRGHPDVTWIVCGRYVSFEYWPDHAAWVAHAGSEASYCETNPSWRRSSLTELWHILAPVSTRVVEGL